MTVIATADAARLPATIGAVRLLRATARLWRATSHDGRIIGHIRVDDDGGDFRYVALRFSARARGLIEVGAFWNPDEAVDCLRWSR
ncbi:MAG: hypothetical protein P0Y48_04645 [Candidatus Microbacterium phytovorans]|uniref:Uncharacterized protein n=1 Tax=Candidatus Microbacterium phytovorans TaxID=3121374 RepID=A0AAJ6B4N0_9MICO|nr:hypothetical protein [Microbacterium sp.]WEK14497.1 MAG: hypothetical protein P0Y48_04645 [Microbacterium sp.]